MVIKIDDSIKNGWTQGKAAKKIIKDALFKIALSYKENRHIVYGNINTIGFLYKEYCKIDPNSFVTKVLSYIKKDINLYTSSIKKIGFELVVVYDDTIKTERFDDHIVVNLTKIERNDFFMNETMLLVENPIDAEFYEVVTERYITKKNFSIFRHQFFPFNGGGSAIKACYELFAKNPKFLCIAITDNDCKYENYDTENGITHKGVTKIDEKYKPFNNNYCIIDVRDAENLIPLEIIQIEKRNAVDAIIRAIQNNTDNKKKIILYFDYKNGLTEKKTNLDPKYREDKNRELNYWKNVFGENYMQTFKTNTETTIYIEGFGLKILEKSIAHIDNSINLNSDLLEKAWDKIGKFIFSYCCTFKTVNQFPNY